MSGRNPAASAVTYQLDSGLGIITIADGRGNRLNLPTLTALISQLQVAYADPKAKLVMLRSGEASFCLGMDLDNLEDSLSSGDAAVDEATLEDLPGGDPLDHGGRDTAVRAYAELLELITRGPKPVIALVEGDVKAGGVGLVAACDVVVASQAASWELSEVLFGLVPYNVLPYVFGLRMSPQRFRYLVLSARRLSAEEARQFGLADEVYAEDQLEKKLKATLKTMMRANPAALTSAKEFFTRMAESPMSERKGAAVDALLERMRDPDVLAGLEAFSSGQSPHWFVRFKPEGPLSAKASSGELPS